MVFPVAMVVIVVIVSLGLILLGIISRKLNKDNRRERERREAARARRNTVTVPQRRPTQPSPPSYEPSTTLAAVNEQLSLQQTSDHVSISIPPPAYKDHRQDRRIQL